jgi:broad specificity phosphatase PhoE
MAIVLVRHGETDGNARRVLQHPDTPLSERGLAQARRVAERLAAGRVARILASDYARALRTAELIRDACGAPLVIEPALRERHFGELRGRAYADLEVDPFALDYEPPGGESWDALHRRVDLAWQRVTEASLGLDGDLVVVTHGLVCHSLVSRLLDLGELGPVPAGFGNTALTIVEPTAPWRVRLLGCVAHLDAETEHDARTLSGL